MTAPAGQREDLHPYEVDLLREFAEVDAPFPLELPSSGTSDAERMVVFNAARQTLAARGLADERGPLGLAEEFVHLLRERTGTLDLVVLREKASLNAVAMVDRSRALLVVQRTDDREGLVRLRLVELDDLVEALLRMIPPAEPANLTPFTLPLRALRAAEAANAERARSGAAPLTDAELTALLAQQGVDDRMVRRMTAQLQPVMLSGQLGATKGQDGEGDDVRVGDELRWIDTPRGRYRLSDEQGPDGASWVSVNPLTLDYTRQAARKLTVAVRR
ncbi:ESX secretion-associated protein EspG [Solihabitans fulvus]|uniref:ESX secretion-associated protein EspG n=1 Tax=Solihabitans fulvus TaxID=1892852 RepID=UPI001661A254|nr:ESX secretion-associated protein EspG [Solihabitans fulvus]